MNKRAAVFFVLNLVCASALAAEACLTCHPIQESGFAPGHAFGSESCTPCHRGDGEAEDEAGAHRGLIAFPGNPDNAALSCGGCHPRQVDGVASGFMATGKGIVAITRRVFGEPDRGGGHQDLSRLGLSPADSLLRKLCASCHLGHPRTAHRLDSPRRGGGCLACHINAFPKDAHPRLTAAVQDRRCFGCHSRSARISLNYRGLAEVEAAAWQGPDAGGLSRLADGRLVQEKEADVHQQAGMGCIDCHTGPGLMGSAEGLRYAREAVDIQCVDCHRNERPRLRLKNWPGDLEGYKDRLPFSADGETPFLTTSRGGTPLWSVEVEGERLWLHRKLAGGKIEIPRYGPESHPESGGHGRLSCDACHGRWAPQCYGCHVEYVPVQNQWDHQEGRITPGRWREERWGVRSEAPALGVTGDGVIRPFVPGMILSIEHPRWERPVFRRLFAALSPHTTGKSRGCDSCHRSSLALGLGAGRLTRCSDGWSFVPEQGPLRDGLPADAWTSLAGDLGGESIRDGDRALSGGEIRRILDAPLPPYRQAPPEGPPHQADCPRGPDQGAEPRGDDP